MVYRSFHCTYFIHEIQPSGLLKRTERFGVPRPGTPESPWLGELDLTDCWDRACPYPGRPQGTPVQDKIKERDRVVSLFLHPELGSVYLSATNGNRFGSRKIIIRKPTSRLGHIGRYSMPVKWMSQGGIFDRSFLHQDCFRRYSFDDWIMYFIKLTASNMRTNRER